MKTSGSSLLQWHSCHYLLGHFKHQVVAGINLALKVPFDISLFSLSQTAQKGRNKGAAIA